MEWPELPISVDFTWCRHGLIQFYADYPEPVRSPSPNGIAEGLQQMHELFKSRNRRQEEALADMARQRILYDEEQRYMQYALALLLQPHEYFRNPLCTRSEYIHACLIKILVEQSIYNYSPFLMQANPMWNEIMLHINLAGQHPQSLFKTKHELLTGMIADFFAPPEPQVEVPVQRPWAYRGHMTMYSGLTCYGDWFTPWGPPLGSEEPSSVELALNLDQEKLYNRCVTHRHRHRRDNNLACASFIPELMGRHDMGGEMLAEVASISDHIRTQFQNLHRIRVQETFQAHLWMKR